MTEFYNDIEKKFEKKYEKIYLNVFDYIKVAIFQFGLSMLLIILLSHYMLIEVIRYLYDNKWFGSHFKSYCLAYKQH